ncbi:endomembrane system acetyl-CoA transmembrane transporter [Schizosaccharomyces pombe]|uniref:Uncharacterized protein C21B10.09 n=1 Tax=Schizosaccharomyces pombe (strain 972 / ATCC 24843) TaxID=284812 RepID=YHZ9_SCHPO|nr:putative acetyl-CoA transporter [Schizosaccharomyces pombe]Q9USW4.1 RecName: Full=Uncharacterized protein C21B10.09 [Schizosaccharomyces pombe 972h-]CAB57921.1 acetyl-CoA transporter (predicted) [Schizosaccharomyces pombe]|eukprot:NP_595678.1 putative acetyl-CoA transporter [Schizosaccharomyces pombe]
MVFKAHHRSITRQDIELEDLENAPASIASIENDTLEANVGSTPLTAKQKRNIYFLILLYLIQGVPMGLVRGSIPYFLKPNVSYSDLATYSLAAYPYSLKVLWSPIVDTYYCRSFGRRKTWVVPCMLLISSTLLLFSYNVDTWISKGSSYINSFTTWSFLLVFVCATQDIAVDGWSLNMLNPEQLSYASTAQTVGLNTGFFLSFTILLVFTSPEFANTFIRSIPSNEGLITLSGYIKFWAYFTFIASVLVCFWDESNHQEIANISDMWKTIRAALSLKNMRQLLIVHTLGKVGFVANETLTLLKATEFGLSNEMLSLIILINFPLGLALGVYTGRISNYRPLDIWLKGYWGRVVSILLNTILVYMVSNWKHRFPVFFPIFLCYTLNASFSTIQFVALGVFHSKISDPHIGGTYMTILNTLSNLGGSWPQYVMLRMADLLTVSSCSTAPHLTCSADAQKKECQALGGTCLYKRDGYYLTSIVGIFLAISICVSLITPVVRRLTKAPISSWHIHSKIAETYT